MPPRTDFSFSRTRRHQAQPQPTPPQQQFVDPQEDSDLTQDDDAEDDELVEEADGEEEEEEEEEEPLEDSPLHLPPSPPLPPNLKEISSLASWTVSSSKPGCSIPQLRSPLTTHFWQSDGPQPHLLNLHFFKRVRIVGVRLYLDFEADESYTPTRILFLAGTGPNDLQEWGELRLEQPRGWVWVGFEGVGDVGDAVAAPGREGGPGPVRVVSNASASASDEDGEDDGSEFSSGGDRGSSDEEEEDEEEGDLMQLDRPRRRRRRARLPELRAHLVQVKILENHQNGKDTHLRGLQIFARDRGVRRGKTEQVVETRRQSTSGRASLGGGGGGAVEGAGKGRSRITMSEWERLPDIR
ncbi:galactose-binding like protein [Mytilinidion resinicola]|uniref:Galactose-binding like protein n=1 Tax=Mytilinidion resinicola TaxID=574789 RepID=A0A6A6Z622_9PEZI|nr:galactose-binding like protein [Mytilinidion resinicola]KAF2815707.1 galactose-binding like protein [Mytilinidion resinicola]